MTPVAPGRTIAGVWGVLGLVGMGSAIILLSPLLIFGWPFLWVYLTWYPYDRYRALGAAGTAQFLVAATWCWHPWWNWHLIDDNADSWAWAWRFALTALIVWSANLEPRSPRPRTG